MGQDRPGWLSETWLRSVARGAKHHLDRSFARWRELYQAAVEQRDAARREVDRPRLTRDERRRAEQREREAKRELELLLNTGDQTKPTSTRTPTSREKASSRATTSRACPFGPSFLQLRRPRLSTDRVFWASVSSARAT